MQFTCNKTEELKTIAAQIINSFPENRVFPIFGKMGAGKTTLTKALCDVLNVVDTVNSPTFAIINEYITDNNQNVYHFDCYRLKNSNEFLEIGGDDYFYTGYYCFVEWPQIIEEYLPDDCVKISISVDEITLQRTITVE